jgi:hypothetical protein
MSSHTGKKKGWVGEIGTLSPNDCYECGAMNPYIVGEEPKPTACASCGTDISIPLSVYHQPSTGGTFSDVQKRKNKAAKARASLQKLFDKE